MANGHSGGPTEIDTSVPNVARIYDYWLGGRENFQADRDIADAIAELAPGVRDAARDNRAFLHRTVRFMARQGITQFLDIGAGPPGMPGTTSVLDVAREINPGARVAYVDYDPMVISHCSALLAHPQSVVVKADLRAPDTLLSHPAVTGHLDFGQPVGVVLMAVLHFVSDDADPAGIVATIRDALAPGSYLSLGQLTGDDLPQEKVDMAVAAFARSSAGSIWPRSADEIRRLFDGFDLVDPGLVPSQEWRPDGGAAPPRQTTFCLGGVGRKT